MPPVGDHHQTNTSTPGTAIHIDMIVMITMIMMIMMIMIMMIMMLMIIMMILMLIMIMMIIIHRLLSWRRRGQSAAAAGEEDDHICDALAQAEQNLGRTPLRSKDVERRDEDILRQQIDHAKKTGVPRPTSQAFLAVSYTAKERACSRRRS